MFEPAALEAGARKACRAENLSGGVSGSAWTEHVRSLMPRFIDGNVLSNSAGGSRFVRGDLTCEGAAMAQAVARLRSVAKGEGEAAPYLWGSERPGVVEKRMHARKKAFATLKEQVRQKFAKALESSLAEIAEEERKTDEKLALVAEHRETLTRRKRTFRVMSSLPRSEPVYTEEQLAEVRAKLPGISDEKAHLVLDILQLDLEGPSQSLAAKGEADRTDPGDVEPTSSANNQPRGADELATAEAVSEREAVSDRGERSAGEAVLTAPSESFDPATWEDGDEIPKGYLSRLTQDGDRVLVPDPDYMDPVEEELTPEHRALILKVESLDQKILALEERCGPDRKQWSLEAQSEHNALCQEYEAASVALARLDIELDERELRGMVR